MSLKTIIYFSAIISTAMAISCYKCSGCDEPFNKATNAGKLTNCPSGTCSKSVGEGYGVTVHVRDCSTTKVQDGCHSMTISSIDVNVCFCNGDACNAQTSVHTKHSLTLATCLLIFYMLKNMF